MAGAPIPDAVAALVGPDAEDRSGEGATRVLIGRGYVAKVEAPGAPSRLDRERWILTREEFPVAVPDVVADGDGWLVTAEVTDPGTPWREADLLGALGDLARLHDAFEDAVPPEAADVLRRPFSPQGVDDLLAAGRSAAYGSPAASRLPAALAALCVDPAPLLAALAPLPPTLTHGDPWPPNIRRPAPGRHVWVDWEHASVAPAAADVATWLDQTPWHLGRPVERDEHIAAYLSARRRPAERDSFERALDAASVLWFLAFDLPHLAAGTAHDAVAASLVAACLAAAERATG